MHGVFVAFPVVLTTEAAGTFGEGAAVRTSMAFEVFACPTLAYPADAVLLQF